MAKVFFFCEKLASPLHRSFSHTPHNKKEWLFFLLREKKAMSHIEGYLAALVTIFRQSVLDNFLGNWVTEKKSEESLYG